MLNKVIIKNKINPFKKTILISGDKSLSIRWVLFSSLADGVSKSKNLLMSQDVFAAIKAEVPEPIIPTFIKFKIFN